MIEYKSVVYNAARDGNLRRLKVFIDSRTDSEVRNLLSSCVFGTPPLVIAARNGHLEVVKYLVEKKVDIEQTGCVIFDGDTIEGASALWCSAAAGRLEMVKFLVENGSNVNNTTSTNSTPLRAACYDGHLPIIKYLIENGANVEIANRHGHTCLMIACYRGHFEVCQYLLSVNANVNAKSLKGNTALHDCAESGSVEIIRLLLDHQALMTTDCVGLTPMLSAANLGNNLVVEFLLDRPECPPEQKVDGLQLLGATYVDKKFDIVGAARCWRRALALRHQYNVPLIQLAVDRASFVAYGGQREVGDEQQLNLLLDEPEHIRVQALLVRERILGPTHPDTTHYIRYRGAVYADVGIFDRCIDLWMYALNIQQAHLEPLCSLTLGSFVSFSELFSFLLNDSSPAQNNHQPVANRRQRHRQAANGRAGFNRPVVDRDEVPANNDDEDVAAENGVAVAPQQQHPLLLLNNGERKLKFVDILLILAKAILEIHRAAARIEPLVASSSAPSSSIGVANIGGLMLQLYWSADSQQQASSSNTVELTTCRHTEREQKTCRKLLLVVLHLASLALRCLENDRSFSEAASKNKNNSIPAKGGDSCYAENKDRLNRLIYELIRMDPRDFKRAALLQLACDENSSSLGDYTLCRFPSLPVVDLLLQAGADVMATDFEGNTALHTCLSNKISRRSVALVLLKLGACLHSKNNVGKTALDFVKLSGLDLPIVNFTSLKQLSAVAVRRHNLAYRNHQFTVPACLFTLLERV